MVVLAVATAGCLEPIRDAVGPEVTHRWEEQVTLTGSSGVGDATSPSLPQSSWSRSFDLPLDTTDLRMEVGVVVPQAGNVTVTLEGPDGVVFQRSYGSTTDDAFQTSDPDAGPWALRAESLGEVRVEVRVDARVPVPG